jgi:hypothetical protein
MKNLILVFAVMLFSATGCKPGGTTEGMKWSIGGDGTLTIGGKGDMPDYDSEEEIPWASHRESITAVVVEKGVTEIGKFAFFGCENLTSVTLPQGVARIGTGAFGACNSLTSVALPQSVTKIGFGTFAGCGSLAAITVEKGNVSFSSEDGVLFDHTGTALVQYPGGKTGEHYDVPHRVTRIKDAAFAWSSLSSVTIPGSVKEIGESVFSQCSSLSDVTVGWQTPLSIEDDTFDDPGHCTLHVPAGTRMRYLLADVWGDFGTITEDGSADNEQASSGREADFGINADGRLTEYTGPGGRVVIPNTVKSIGDEVFQYNKTVTSVTLPDGVKRIGVDAFSGCSMTSITLPNSVTSIGERAFSACGGLTSVTLPNSVTEMEGWAFTLCDNLTSVTLSNNLTTIGEFAFGLCIGLKSVTVPNSVTTIENLAFSASGLTSVTLPNSVARIEDGAFAACKNLTSVTLPGSVKKIGKEVFAECGSLTDVTVEWKTPLAIPDNAFGDVDGCTLHVPAGTKARYQAAQGWKKFGRIE